MCTTCTQHLINKPATGPFHMSHPPPFPGQMCRTYTKAWLNFFLEHLLRAINSMTEHIPELAFCSPPLNQALLQIVQIQNLNLISMSFWFFLSPSQGCKHWSYEADRCRWKSPWASSCLLEDLNLNVCAITGIRNSQVHRNTQEIRQLARKVRHSSVKEKVHQLNPY